MTVTIILFGLLYLGSFVFDRDISRVRYILSRMFLIPQAQVSQDPQA